MILHYEYRENRCSINAEWTTDDGCSVIFQSIVRELIDLA